MIKHVGRGMTLTLLLASAANALTSAGVPVRLIRVPGGQHGPYFLFFGKDEPRRPDDFGEARKWFDRYLKAAQ